MHRGTAWVAFVCAVSGFGCGPSEAEIGAAVVCAAPFFVLIGYLHQCAYAAAWQHLGVDVEVRAKPTIVVLVITAVAAIAVVSVARQPGLISLAFWAGGASHIAILMVAMRATLRSRSWYSAAVWLPFALIIVPAFLFATVGSREHSGDFVMVLAMPGYFGIVPAILFVFMALEIVLSPQRKLMRSIRQSAATPPPPAE